MPRHGASKPIFLCVPSQNGLVPEFPQRQSTVRSTRSIARQSQIITIRGDSYRLCEKRRSGRLQKPGPAPAETETNDIMTGVSSSVARGRIALHET